MSHEHKHPLPPDEMEESPEKDMCLEAADGAVPTTVGPSTAPPNPSAT